MTKRSRIVLACLGALLVLTMVLSLGTPGWAAPDQSLGRQTVPTRTPAPTLIPWAYLPVVIKNASAPTQ